MKLKGKYYIVKTYSGSYDDYHEEWWEVHESVLPIEEAITEYFMKAEKKLERTLIEHRKRHKAILCKYGRAKLGGKDYTTFTADSPHAQGLQLSEECLEEIRKLDKEFPIDLYWENFVDEVSGGKVRKLKPHISFKWKERWER